MLVKILLVLIVSRLYLYLIILKLYLLSITDTFDLEVSLDFFLDAYSYIGQECCIVYKYFKLLVFHYTFII